MAITVYANGNGFFHKGSGGSGKAFPDVCLSPPPAPTGPVPVPYNNSLSASDLAEGSKTVKIDGEPTALEDTSYVSTSTGDEGGNQGGNVVTHKTKGKGYFMLWSFDVQVEGKGVDRHDDPMGQNCASAPIGAADIKAKVKSAEDVFKQFNKCPRPYQRHKDRYGSPTDDQTASVQGRPCWMCGKITKPMVADHKPSRVQLYYEGGCESSEKQKEKVRDLKGVFPQCQDCFAGDGGPAAAFSRAIKALYQAARAAGFY